MTTGAFWDTSNPKKPVGEFDPQSILDIPFDWATWLTDIGATYASHTVTTSLPLEVVSSSVASGVVTARIQVKSGETTTLGSKIGVTCHLVASDGQAEDQTVWLKVVSK